MINPQGARREMFARIGRCWEGKSGLIVGGADPEMRYQGVEQGAKPGPLSFWARASTKNAFTRQAAHQMPREGEGGAEVIYTTYGAVFIQVFAPMKNPHGWAHGELLAELGQRMFMASETSSAVWFRNPRYVELENDGTWYRWNVIADYQFNHAKGA